MITAQKIYQSLQEEQVKSFWLSVAVEQNIHRSWILEQLDPSKMQNDLPRVFLICTIEDFTKTSKTEDMKLRNIENGKQF